MSLLRIAFVDLLTSGGGVPVVMGRLIAGLLRTGQGTEVILVDPYGDARSLLQIPDDVAPCVVGTRLDPRTRRIRRVPWPGRLRFIGDLVVYGVRLGFVLRKRKADLVVFNLAKSGPIAWLASVISGSRLVFYSHGVWHRSDMGLVYRFLLWRASAIIAVSEDTKRQITSLGIPESKVTVLYNAVDTETIKAWSRNDVLKDLGVDTGSFAIGCVGNIISRKGIDVLVEAFGILVRDLKASDAVLLIAGDDPGESGGAYSRLINRTIEHYGIGNRVKFLGFRTDVDRLLHAFDLFVMPSRMESFGVAIIEAMRASIPVIATNSGSIPEVVAHEETGLLVRPECPVELATAVHRMRSDPELRKALSANALRIVRDRFALDRQVRRFLAAVHTRIPGDGR